MSFESSVNSDGTQTARCTILCMGMFESSVNSDGTQTVLQFTGAGLEFESSVNSDGTQTSPVCISMYWCLRVV